MCSKNTPEDARDLEPRPYDDVPTRVWRAIQRGTRNLSLEEKGQYLDDTAAALWDNKRGITGLAEEIFAIGEKDDENADRLLKLRNRNRDLAEFAAKCARWE